MKDTWGWKPKLHENTSIIFVRKYCYLKFCHKNSLKKSAKTRNKDETKTNVNISHRLFIKAVYEVF